MMEGDQNHTPSGCFPLNALQRLQAVEHASLAAVFYHVRTSPDGAQLLALELVTDDNTTIVLGSEHDEPAISVMEPQEWLDNASKVLEPLQRHAAVNSPLWKAVMHQTIRGILLSRNEDGLALNDALVIDFGSEKRIVQIEKTAGLAIGHFP
jgi:hypothetical protein